MSRAGVGRERDFVGLRAAVLACSLVMPALSRVQAGDAAGAQRAFDEAQSLMAANEYAKACSKFEESQRLDAQLGTLLHLANCHERLGKLASAWREFSAAVKLAAARNAAGENEPREATARRRAEDLEWRMSSITLDVTQRHAADLRIELDGQPLHPSQWGQRQPVDPGEHQITARAPGQQTWTHGYSVEREGTRLRILIPGLRAAAEPPAPPVEAKVEQVIVPGAYPSSGNTQRVAGYVVSGASIAGAGVTLAFFIAASNASSEQDAYWERCKSSPASCSAQDVAKNNRLNDRVHSNATAMYVVGGVSAAAAIAGLTLLLTAPTGEHPTDIALSILPGQAYFSLRGSTF